jgi:hypothetical protein
VGCDFGIFPNLRKVVPDRKGVEMTDYDEDDDYSRLEEPTLEELELERQQQLEYKLHVRKNFGKKAPEVSDLERRLSEVAEKAMAEARPKDPQAVATVMRSLAKYVPSVVAGGTTEYDVERWITDFGFTPEEIVTAAIEASRAIASSRWRKDSSGVPVHPGGLIVSIIRKRRKP